MGIIRRGRHWHARYKDANGFWRLRSLHTQSHEEARRRYELLIVEVVQARLEVTGVAQGIITIKEAISGYLRPLSDEVRHRTLQARTGELNMFEKYCQTYGIEHLHELTAKHLEGYKIFRLHSRNPPTAPSTTNKAINHVAAMLNYYVRLEVLTTNPAKKVKRLKEEPPDIRVFTGKEIDAMLHAAKPHMRRLITVLYFSGMRIGSALGLQWQDIDFENSSIAIQQSKTKPYTVPLHERIRAELHHDQQERGPVLLNSRGAPLCYQAAALAFKTFQERLNIISPGTLHDLRHSFATQLARAGCDPYRLQKLLGHANLSMTQRYFDHLVLNDLRKGIELL